MIDTLKLKISGLSGQDLAKIESKLIERKAVNNETGEELYSIISGSLAGSYDNSIAVSVYPDNYKYNQTVDGKYIPEVLSGFIYIEFSLHKFLQGQNITFGSDDLDNLAKFQVFFENQFLVELPDFQDWEVMRLDYANNFKLPKDQIYLYLKSMRNLSYSRRQVNFYGDDTIYAAGATTTIKIYFKGAEFQKHDFPRLKNFLETGRLVYLYQLLDLAQNVLRCEVELKPRFLRKHFGKKVIQFTDHKELTKELQPKVKDIKMDKVKELYDIEVEKLMKNRQVKISKNSEVLAYLKKAEEKNWQIYYGTWILFQTQTPAEVKNMIGKDKYYRHLKILKKHNIVISAHGDITINKDFNLIPIDFNLYSTSKYLLKSEIAI